MFHVEQVYKSHIFKGLLTSFFLFTFLLGCGISRQVIDVSDYVLVPNAKQIIGYKEGATAFVFENNQRQIPFADFLVEKYKLGRYSEIEFWVNVEGNRLKLILYDNDELEKYIDTSQFLVSNVEPEMTIVGSRAKFIAVSVIDSYNQDCLTENSLYFNLAIN